MAEDRGFHDFLEPRLRGSGELGDMTDWAGKLRGAVLRIAGLLHLAERSRDRAPWQYDIARSTMAKAVKIGEFLIPHAQAAYAMMGADQNAEDARYALAKIKGKGLKEFSKRDLHRATPRFKKADELDPVLEFLIERDYLRQKQQEDTGGSGRKPSPTFEANPMIDAGRN